jgi:hypothetical protein
MRKSIPLFLILFLFIPVIASAQSWQFQGVFPDSATWQNTAHGLAVDNDGKVWVAPYNSQFPVIIGEDTVRRNQLFVFNEDGSPAAFSPINQVTVGDSTLYFAPISGLNRDQDGNIIVSMHGRRWPYTGASWLSDKAFIFRLNSATGELMDFAEHTYMRTETAAQAPNRAAVITEGDEAGYMIVSFVWDASPMIIIGPDLGFVAEVTSERPGFARTLEVSPDGKTIYSAGFTVGYMPLYYSEDGVFGEYEMLEDTTFAAGMQTGTVAIDPTDPNILWVAAAGGGNDPTALPPWDSRKVYALDVTTGAAVDSVMWNYVEGEPYRIMRSMAFHPGGETLYLGTFSTGIPAVQKFSKVTSVRRDDDLVPVAFQLNQNYPNPFNPATEIGFTLNTSGMTTLKVYDILGREVTTLVNEHLSAGGYTVTFDAANLTSGTYLYILESQGQRQMMKMMLVK